MATARTELSARQWRMLEFIRAFQRERGYPPTIREIGQAADISSTSVVDYNLKILRNLGYLRRDAEVSRGIGLIVQEGEEDDSGASANVVRVPVVGSIAAGEPIEAYTVLDEKLELSRELADDNSFALRVRGKSMIEDLIDDGDIVVIKRQSTAENGAIVVALITDSPSGEGQATLKRIYREKDRIRLQPANSEMAPIYVRPDELQVQGKVTTVIRRL
jgi:repressor LexA